MSDHAGDLTSQAIAERFRWARRQGHPSYLWPDVPVPTWRACLREIEISVAEVLRGAAAPVALRLPEGANAKALGIAAFTTGTGPLLGYWLETAALTCDEDVAALLCVHLDHGRRRARRLASELARVLDLFADEGISAVVVKGAATAHLYFPDPGTRPVADIDLVLSPLDLDRATRVLERSAYVRTTWQSRPFKSDWVPPGAPDFLRSIELTHAENPYTIEIHDSLDRTFFGVRTVRLGAADHRSTLAWPALQDSARVLAAPLELAFLAVHASEELHQLQLVRLVELVFAVRTHQASGQLVWGDAAEILERADARRFAYPAFELTERLAPGTVDEGLREWLAQAAPPRMHRVVERLTPSTAQRLEKLSLEERFMWAATPGEVLRRAAYLVWPAHATHSRRPLTDVYLERIFRVTRGRVSLRTRALTQGADAGRPPH